MDRTKIVVVFGRFLTAGSLVFLLVKLGKHFHEIPRFTHPSTTGILLLILAIFFSTAAIGINSYIWGVILLRGGGVFVDLRKAFVIYGKSQIRKYLPGNVFQYVGRITLSREAGISTEAAMLSTGVEAFLSAGTAASIAGAGILLDRRPLIWLIGIVGTTPLGFAFCVAVGFLAIVSVGTILLRPMRTWIRLRLTYLQEGRIVQCALLWLLVFTMYGVLISLLLSTVWKIDTELRWYQFTWGFALAWVMGFIVPGAPAGIGIREAILVGLYSVPLGEGAAFGLATVLRIVTSLGDLLALMLAGWLSRKEISPFDYKKTALHPRSKAMRLPPRSR